MNPFTKSYKFICTVYDGTIEIKFLNQLGFYWVLSIVPKIKFMGEKVALKSIQTIQLPRYSVQMSREYNEFNVIRAFAKHNLNNVNIGKWIISSFETTEETFKCIFSVPNLAHQYIKSKNGYLDFENGPILLTLL